MSNDTVTSASSIGTVVVDILSVGMSPRACLNADPSNYGRILDQMMLIIPEVLY